MRRYFLSALVIICFILVLPFTYGGCSDGGGGNGGGDPGGGGIEIDEDDIGGTVTRDGAPEAGVWVIAQADVGNTNYRKIVVTNGQGEFVIPDLPEATYGVWVRGYGLVDSNPVQVSPGELIDLEAVPAATPQEAAQVYPANFWYSLLEPPSTDMFPGTMTEEDPGNGIPSNVLSQADWVSITKRENCLECHQQGTAHTRGEGHNRVTPQAWEQVWQLPQMARGSLLLGQEVAAEVFADYASRIADGEVPPMPPRPQGIERNFVITQWDWGDGLTYSHDEISTDKRDPTLYPYGKVYGNDLFYGRLVYVDPVTNEVGEYVIPGLNPPGRGGHNPMLDDQGRVWLTQLSDGQDRVAPDFCTDGSRGDVDLPNASTFGYFDTVTEEYVVIPICGSSHHLQFGMDGILWLSSPGGIALQWFDPSIFDPDDPATIGPAFDWREVRVDSDGDGVADTNTSADGWTLRSGYGIIASPVDGTVWLGNRGTPFDLQDSFPSQIVRYDPAIDMFEAYEPIAPGLSPAGIDVTTDGVVWTCLVNSSHLARFDRSQCAQTYGAGDQCPEGWTLWELPGPHFKGVPEVPGNADFPYYAWVDQHNTLGLGENMVVCTGTNSDSQIVFNPETEEFIQIRTPFPLGMFTRGLDGRIDDPNAGWKGRGWWITNGIDPVSHLHHEPNNRHDAIGWVQQVQFRPNSLDK